MLCDVEGLSYEEIAEILGIKLGTVRSRIHRGRAMLRKALAHRAPQAGRSRYSGPSTGPISIGSGGLVIGHLGSRVSALLDGQLSPRGGRAGLGARARCHACRDQVEREGWVKTRLAGLSFGETPTPDHLKGSLLGSRRRRPWPLRSSRRTTAGCGAASGWSPWAAAPSALPFVGVLALGAPRRTRPRSPRPADQHDHAETTRRGLHASVAARGRPAPKRHPVAGPPDRGGKWRG